MYKYNIFFIILYFSLLYSCCNDNENMYKPINGNDLKEGDYYDDTHAKTPFSKYKQIS
jgi:hypothetical protein